jgi:uncharacterized protein YqfA (UPF0365 family)
LTQLELDDRAVETASISLAERLARLVSNPLVSSLLLAAGVLLLIGDLLSGGVGIGAAVGVGLLAVFLGGHLIAGLAGWEDVALVVVGVLLLLLEVFVLPGVGLAGALGIVAILGGAFLATLNRDFDVVGTDQLLRAGMTVGFAFVLIAGGLIVLMTLLTRRGGPRRLVLGATLGDDVPVTQRSSRGWLGWFDADAVLASDRDDHVGARPPGPDGDLPAGTEAAVATAAERPGPGAPAAAGCPSRRGRGRDHRPASGRGGGDRRPARRRRHRGGVPPGRRPGRGAGRRGLPPAGAARCGVDLTPRARPSAAGRRGCSALVLALTATGPGSDRPCRASPACGRVEPPHRPGTGAAATEVMMEPGTTAFFVGIALILLVIVAFFYFVPVGLWITALFSGVRVSLGTLIGMRLRKVVPAEIVRPLISATKAGLDLDITQMEAHYLAGGRVEQVVTALISADRANIELPWKRATAIDLAGRDVLQAVQVSVNPKVIETPRIAAVAKDGIQVIAVARVTVRANIERLVGGAGEETIIARVGEGSVSSIGSADSHKYVLENPDDISRRVLERGLDAGTAFEILSIDIADVDIGRNIGAELQTDQAEADKKIAQAKAEERRAMAVAEEQEMRARVVEAEAEVPRALAEALRSGNLGVMDSYRLDNVQADTRMRESIAGDDDAERVRRDMTS